MLGRTFGSDSKHCQASARTSISRLVKVRPSSALAMFGLVTGRGGCLTVVSAEVVEVVEVVEEVEKEKLERISVISEMTVEVKR
jgi:hypothetical protein